MMRFIAISFSALALGAPAGAATNLIVDGGFEANPASHGGYGHTAGGTSFDGGAWHVTGVDILQIDTNLHDNSSPSVLFAAHGGQASLDLTGTGNSGPADGVFQDVATQAGQAYRLNFWVGHVSSTGSARSDYPHDATMRLSIDGGPLMEFVNGDRVDNAIAWKAFTVDFVATASTSRIAFLNGLGNDYLGLDDVSLTGAAPAPELSLWAMLTAGMAMVGVALRRRPRIAFA
jgi:hypothetical protein